MLTIQFVVAQGEENSRDYISLANGKAFHSLNAFLSAVIMKNPNLLDCDWFKKLLRSNSVCYYTPVARIIFVLLS